MAGGVGYAWFEVELVSYPLIDVEPVGDVRVLAEAKLETVMPTIPGSLIIAIAPSANLAVLVGNSTNLSVGIQQEPHLDVEVDDSDNLKILDP